jgi:hypothetical protein
MDLNGRSSEIAPTCATTGPKRRWGECRLRSEWIVGNTESAAGSLSGDAAIFRVARDSTAAVFSTSQARTSSWRFGSE